MFFLAVIINEHLMEALRRLRRNSTDFNVDRRLVTNVLLSFLSTPRADGKRFEILSLLASVLSWNDLEREKAGLQRVSSSDTSPASSFWGRSSSVGSPAKAELDKSDETEVGRSSAFLYNLHTHTLTLTLPPLASLSLDSGWNSYLQKHPLANHHLNRLLHHGITFRHRAAPHPHAHEDSAQSIQHRAYLIFRYLHQRKERKKRE